MRFIYDENGNGKWDTGTYLENKQPEKVVYFSGKFDVRSGWDLELISSRSQRFSLVLQRFMLNPLRLGILSLTRH